MELQEHVLPVSVPTLGSLVDGNIHSIADSDESTFAEVCLEALTYLPTSASSSPSNATVRSADR